MRYNEDFANEWESFEQVEVVRASWQCSMEHHRKKKITSAHGIFQTINLGLRRCAVAISKHNLLQFDHDHRK